MTLADDFGLSTPEGTDLVSLGDNAITQNAVRTAELLDAFRYVRDNPGPIDLNTYKRPGLTPLPAPYPTGSSNYPEGNNTASVLLNLFPQSESYGSQLVFQYGANPRAWWRTMRSITGNTWNDWKEFSAGGTGGGSLHVSASHAMRVQAFKDAYPLVSTGGRGAVVIRLDHGLNFVKSTLYPLAVEFDIPIYIAMNSRNWSLPQSDQVTQAEAREWIASGLVEFGNHNADHEDKTTEADLWDAIVNGRRELEDQLQTTIHGYTVPGVGGTAMMGFGSGTLNTFSETYAGGLILANHGIASGAIGPTLRPLDGEVRQGGRHFTFESSSWATIQSQVDEAVTAKAARTFMAHPNTLAGRSDGAAISRQLFEYLRQQIDAGNLARISYYQSHHATTAEL